MQQYKHQIKCNKRAKYRLDFDFYSSALAQNKPDSQSGTEPGDSGKPLDITDQRFEKKKGEMRPGPIS